jgi:probable HAF family extracellular repeat protein
MSRITTFSLLLLSACVTADDAAPAPEVATTSAALACTTYTVTDLGIPAGGGASAAVAIDDAGNVAGTYRPTTGAEPNHPFRWSAATGLVDLGTLGGSNAFAHGISGARVVGESTLANGDTHAFLADGTGIHDLGVLPGGGGIDASRAFGVTPSGLAVGTSRDASGFLRAVSFAGGSVIDLGTLVGAAQSNAAAAAVNANGVIVGSSDTASGRTHAAKWSGESIADLGSVGTDTSVANAVNASGAAAGNLLRNFSPRPALFANGTVTEIGILTGFERGTATGINDAGLVVGTLQHQSGEAPGISHGYIWDGTTQLDLNTMITGSGWQLQAANAINNAGQIAGAGISTATGMGADTRTHALVLTPSCGTPTFRSIATTTNGTTVARPAGVVAGDFLLAALEYDANPLVITPPAGWTLVRDQLAGAGTPDAYHALVYAHVATASEPASYTFASPAGVYVDVQVAAYTGATAVDAVASTAVTASSISAPSVTTSRANERLVVIYIDFAGGSWTTASGMTRRSNFDSNSLQDQLRPTAGATGVRTASDTTGAMAAISLALK